MRSDYEIRHHAMLEAYERCCENCNKKYWETCTGIRPRFNFESVDGCKNALEVYTVRFNKLLNRYRC